MEQAAHTLPLPPPPLGEGGVKRRLLPGPWKYTTAAEQPLQRQQTPFSRQEALTPARPYGTETWKRLSLGLFSRRGSISLPARAQRRLRRQGRYSAAIFRHIPPSLPPAPSEQLGGEVTTPDLPPLSLARTPQILARLMGQAKLWF